VCVRSGRSCRSATRGDINDTVSTIQAARHRRLAGSAFGDGEARLVEQCHPVVVAQPDVACDLGREQVGERTERDLLGRGVADGARRRSIARQREQLLASRDLPTPAGPVSTTPPDP